LARVTSPDPLRRPEYPRSSTYDAQWLIESDMGPHPLWLLEDLAQDLDLRPGMRVLDLACGKGATSVFLAREFGARVWAADLWVSPDENAATFEAHGVGDQVTALKAEAHALPFARGFFDVIVCIDAYEYFGTADGYLAYLTSYLKPGGQLGIATPAMRREVRELGRIPEHIRACVGWEALAWHTAEWWRFQWDVTELVTVTAARLQESGWRDWLAWERACNGDADRPVIRMLEADQGELLTFAIVAARKEPEE
jgi:SAM-dependent methyltransferase